MSAFLEYPRWLHRAGESKIVANQTEADAAQREGWTVDRVGSPSDPVTESPREAVPPLDVPRLDAPVARKRGRPKKLKELSDE